MDVAAPTLDDTPDTTPTDDDTSNVVDAPTRPRRRRRLLDRLALPAGALELGVFAVVCFVLWWTTRSWLLAGLLAVGWLLIVGVYRAWHRTRRATTVQRRVSRERLTTYAVWTFLLFGCVAGIRAWSTRNPTVPKPDPPNLYLTAAGTVTAAWDTLYGRPAIIRAVTQTAPAYWVAVVQDSEGCWTQAVILRTAPLVAGERAPAPCPQPTYAPTQHGDKIDPTKSPGARAAVDFVTAWLGDTNWAIYTAPGSKIHPLGRTIDVTGLAVYPIAVNDHAATVWVVGQADDGPLGVQVGLVDDQGRWFVTGIAGSPPVDVADTEPLPAPTTTTTTVPTTTTQHK